MKKFTALFRIFIISVFASCIIIAIKYYFHFFGWEFVEQSSLHTGVISSAFFVIGFLMSATIADYKESERIPADFSSNLEDMYTDAKSIHKNYPKFDIKGYKNQLIKITQTFDNKTRHASHGVSEEIRELSNFFAEMEKAGVPPNFVVKLKTQQALLLRHRKRISYIQRINFIPSATILARSIALLVITLLITTNIEPFQGSLFIVGIISFVMIYIMILINTISKPFHVAGKTRDDVSMFLIDEAGKYLKTQK